MNFAFEKNGDIGVITFEGDLTSRHLDDIRSVLLISLGSADSLVLSLDQTTEVDSACMQLFCKTIRASRKFCKTIIMTGTKSRDLGRLINHGSRDCSMECSECSMACVAGQE